jgi:hypothetical protein
MSRCTDRNPALIAQYEQLRCDVLNRGAVSTHGFGLALSLRQGMTGWMRACAECASDIRRPSASPLRLAVPLPPEVHSQLTLIVASLLTRPRQERYP